MFQNHSRRRREHTKTKYGWRMVYILWLSAVTMSAVPRCCAWTNHCHSRPASTKSLRTQELANSRPSTTSNTSQSSDLVDILQHRFQGDFDNYRQVVEDRQEGLMPGKGGGHEHIHCCLVPVSESSRLAAFYFNGNPTAIFRFRYYHLVSRDEDTVDTILYTLSKSLEIELRSCSDPMRWPELFRKYIQCTGTDEDDSTICSTAITEGHVTLLPLCEVRWSRVPDPVQHAYVPESESSSREGVHAVMVHGEAIVDSQMQPGNKILIKDQLSLYDNALWIHDRGFDPETGEFIYGNQLGVPYILNRVANTKRDVTDVDLAWTLGNEFRTEELYCEKMNLIGNVSPSGIKK